MTAHWELFPHEADAGIRGTGDTPEEAFSQAATALTAVVTDPRRVTPRQAIEIHCENPDRSLLLVDWLNALIYEMATRHMLFSRFSVTLDGPRLTGVAEGEPVDVRRHQPAAEVKGATYTELKVEQIPDGWTAQCVVDV
jgi:SHS2 domain-containing protein